MPALCNIWGYEQGRFTICRWEWRCWHPIKLLAVFFFSPLTTYPEKHNCNELCPDKTSVATSFTWSCLKKISQSSATGKHGTMSCELYSDVLRFGDVLLSSFPLSINNCFKLFHYSLKLISITAGISMAYKC